MTSFVLKNTTEFDSNFLLKVLGYSVLVICVFLVIRELVCWYWKINERSKKAENTNELLNQQCEQINQLLVQIQQINSRLYSIQQNMNITGMYKSVNFPQASTPPVAAEIPPSPNAMYPSSSPRQTTPVVSGLPPIPTATGSSSVQNQVTPVTLGLPPIPNTTYTSTSQEQSALGEQKTQQTSVSGDQPTSVHLDS